MGVCCAWPLPAIVVGFVDSAFGVSLGRGYAALRPSFPAVVSCHGGADVQRFGVWPYSGQQEVFRVSWNVFA
jgi:hypothetical protein